MARLLIVDDVHEALFPLISPVVQIDYQPDITPEQVHAIIGQYEGLLLRSKLSINASLIGRAERLRFIARAGAGFDHLDDSAMKERHIALLTAPEGNRDAVGEQAIGMLLALMNNLARADRQVRQKQWLREENRGYEIQHKTVGIIGYGNMGRAFASRIGSFGCRVLAYDRYKTNYGDQHAQEVPMETIFQEADILSLHIPLNDANRYLADEQFFDQFRKPIWLVNTARGEVAPLRALRYALEKGLLRGAALDVLENEKLHTLTPEQQAHFEALAQMDNVLFSPHVAGWTYESYEKISLVLGEKIVAFLSQHKP